MSGVQVRDLERELGAALEGEVRFDETARLLYSTDASIYQIMPVGVVVPRHAGDVATAVRIAAERQVPILPRGSGTSLAGQTVGAALVLDFTPHMRNVLEVRPEERQVRVQPGVILDELNAQLRPQGLMFAPDVATSNRASIGGMMGNNSCGARSIRYGRTVDHVLAQEVVLSDGMQATFAEVTPEEWRRRGAANSREGRIYREVWRLCEEHAEEVDRRFPRIMRRVGGYNLDEIVRRQRYNLASLMVGSEGTLAVVTEATLNLVPTPRKTALLVSHFNDLLAALDATVEICRHEPAAVELVDRIILDLTKGNMDLAPARSRFLQGEPEAILVTELNADTDEELVVRLDRLSERLQHLQSGYAHVPLREAAAQKDVWNVRKAGLGLLMGMKGDAKPVGFIEDTAVAPECLADYIRDLRALLDGYGLDACYYAHASVGCLHVRPILNLKKPEDRLRMRQIGSDVADLVLKYGGAMSAEHGDGLARSEWQERMFGPQLYRAFREVKAAFDPQGLMNPGKIVEAPSMHENLRLHPKYQTIPVETLLDFSGDHGFAGAVEMCSGVGACRKKLDGVMCPSYRATMDEQHSTRGRANMLRMVLSGQAGPDPQNGKRGLADSRLHEVLDLCLECKACKSECPSNVDMAKLKYEFLFHYQQAHGVPLRSRLLANPAGAGAMAKRLAPIANWALRQPWVRGLLEREVGIDRRRSMPAFAERTFREWFRVHKEGPKVGTRGEVLLLADTLTNYHEPEVGEAAVRVLEALGYRVRLPELKCCGRPMISKGLLREARELAEHNVRALLGPIRAGVPLLGLEPSCLVTFRDEYQEFRLGSEAGEVAHGSWLLDDFLAEHHGGNDDLPFRPTPRAVKLHGHCQQKAVLGTRGTVRALGLVPGYEVTEIPSGCCGMAGTFGYEAEHYDVSLKIGELGLLPAVRATPAETLLVAPGTSCRHQIRDATGRVALHPAQALALALP